MSLPSDLVSALPASLTPSRVRAAIRAPGSPGSYSGESWLLELDDGLALVFRTSIFDPLEWLALAADDEPAVASTSDGFSSRLRVRSASGSTFELRPASSDVAKLDAMLERVRGLAAMPGEPTKPGEPSEPAPKPASTSFEPPRAVEPTATLEPVAALELLPGEIDLPPAPPLERADQGPQLDQALARGDFRSALLAARQSTSDPQALADLITLLELAAAGAVVPAYLWTRGVKSPPADQYDAFFSALAAALERADEPTLAWSAWEEVVDEQISSAARKRLERALARSGPTIAQEVATRAQAWFTEQLADLPNEVDAMRGLAQAHTDLDELSQAHTWVQAALAREPMHFDARMQEAQILTLLEIETGDTRPLRTTLSKIAKDFPTRTEPLLDLAGHVEFDDPNLAISCLERALRQEFDEYTVTSLVELYATSGRHMEAISLIERALSSGELDLDADQREQLQAQLFAARTGLSSLAIPAGAEISGHEQLNPRTLPIIMVGVIIVVLLLLAVVIS